MDKGVRKSTWGLGTGNGKHMDSGCKTNTRRLLYFYMIEKSRYHMYVCVDNLPLLVLCCLPMSELRARCFDLARIPPDPAWVIGPSRMLAGVRNPNLLRIRHQSAVDLVNDKQTEATDSFLG